MENVFYVYVYLNPRKPGEYNYGETIFDYEPFYIGKGKGNRLYDHWKNVYHKNETSNRHKTGKIRKILAEGIIPIIFPIYQNLPQEVACNIETILINRIGKFDNKKGPLCNLTDGGDRVINLTEESRRKISEKLKGNTSPMKGKHHKESSKKLLALAASKQMKGIPRTDYEKSCISKAHKGKIVSEETRRKASESHKGQTAWNKGKVGAQKAWNKGLTAIYGVKTYQFLKDRKIVTINNLKSYCIENNLQYASMICIANSGVYGKYKYVNYKGYSKPQLQEL